jgi:hypothetical protein
MRFLLLFIMYSLSSFAQDFEYPELQVVPRASERIKMEAARESEQIDKDLRFLSVPATFTLAAGALAYGNASINDNSTPAEITSQEDKNDSNALAAMIVGGAWLGAYYYYKNNFRPYAQANSKLRKMKSRTKKDQLAKERIAEEALEDSAELMDRMKWFSIITIVGSNITLQGSTNSNESSLLSVIGLTTSIYSAFTASRWHRNHQKHEEYKKRVFGPITVNNLLIDPFSQRLSYGLALSASF